MAKMTICKGCGATMDKRAKSCPQCGRKNKKPVRFIVTGVIIYVIIMIVIVGNIAKRNEKEEDSYSTYRWPSNGIAALLPEPNAEYGEITNESEDSFGIDLYHMSKNDFEDYIAECKDEGFSVDYNKTSSSYYADDRNGNSLSIWYDEDDEEMTIRIMAAVDEIDEDRRTDEIADNNMSNNADNNTDNNAVIPDHENHEEGAAENTEITDAAETGSETEETETDETENSDSQNTENVEFREWVDSYEAFMNEYIDFMENYDSTDLSMLTRYSELMSTYTAFLNDTNALKEDDYSVSDWAYYMEAYVRIMNRLSTIQ